MFKVSMSKFSIADKKVANALILLVIAFVLLTLVQDFLRAELKNSAFYFSESLLYSSFWWLFLPLLFIQYFVVNLQRKKRIAILLAVILLPAFVHLFAFPLLVSAISSIVYFHTYGFQQVLRYTLSEQVYLLVIIYSIPVLIFYFFHKKQHPSANASAISEKSDVSLSQFITTILVSDGNKKLNIVVADIFYFSANPPYINIHLEGKKYLHLDTLKSMSIKLNPKQFIRVHKSSIVNIEMVTSYTTRLNGDYDLTMKNNTIIRVSRNFAGNFINQFVKIHQDTIK